MWTFFDSSWLAYRAQHTMGELTHDGNPTGVIFSYLSQILHVCQDPRILSNRVWLFFDSKHSLRKQAFPGYKDRHKTRTDEEWAEIHVMHEQLKRLRCEILPDIGFPCSIQWGLESDDLMARAVEDTDPFLVTMVTADGDLFQCLRPNCVWFDPARNKYLDTGYFWAHKGCSPEDWAMVKAIGGCTSDTVPGVTGVAEKTATLYVNGQLPTTHARYKAITSADGQATIARNLPLVKLPHTATTPIPDCDKVGLLFYPKYNPDAFYRWCERLGFSSYASGARRYQWDSFFNNTIGTNKVEPRAPRV